MKKLLVPAVLLVLLMIATAVGLIFKNSNDTEPTESEGNTSLLVINNADVSRISVVSVDGSSLAFTSTLAEDGTQTWSLEGDDGSLDLSQTAIASYVSLLSSYSATTVISEPGDLSEYGLATPDYTVNIEKVDGTVATVYIGSYSYDNSACYCMLEGDPNLYMVAALKRDNCAYTANDFRSTQILNLSYDHIDSIEFIRRSDDLDLMIDCVSEDDIAPEFYFISPFERDTNGFFDNTLKFFAKLNITGFMDITPVEIAQFRLDEPAFTFVYTLNNGTSYTIELSENMAGYYYGYCSGVDVYFKLDANSIGNGGLEMPILTMIDNNVVSFQANEISSIEGSYGDESFDFEVNCTEDMTDENATATLNMRNAYVETSFGRTYAAILFENLVSIEISGADFTAEPELDPELTFVYNTKEYTSTTVDFVVRDNNSYYVFIDGEYTGFFVYSNELFQYGGTDTYSYGAWSAYLLTQEAIDNAVANVYDMPEESETVAA